jgi:ribosome maturation factor RimP
MADRDLEQELERRLEELGYELVELEQAGNQRRPILRLRVDRLEAEAEKGITLEDCVAVSRALEPHLDQRPGLSEHYVLEVSSPGVERPLTKRRHFERFAGQEAALQGKTPLADRARRLEGVLGGVVGEGAEEKVLLRLPGGEEVQIPREQITRANLVYRDVRSGGRKTGKGSSP